MVNIAYKTTNIIRKDLFDHMQTLPLKYFDSQTHGEIMSRFTNDVDNVQMMLEQSMVQLVSSVFTFATVSSFLSFPQAVRNTRHITSNRHTVTAECLLPLWNVLLSDVLIDFLTFPLYYLTYESKFPLIR